MFLMHYVPESNLLNPAVRTPCKWYVGLPVLSSLHLNYANNAFSYKELINSNNSANIDELVGQLHWRNYIGTEVHTQLLALGYNHINYSIVFSINEKSSIPITLPKDALELAWLGNTQFEGSTVGLKGTGVYLNHYREFALSISKPMLAGGYWGVRAKVLFGKLNVSTRSTDISVTTDENTFDLNFDGDLLVHSSLPIVAEATDNQLTRLEIDDNLDIKQLILNRKNPGFAIDLGIVYPYSKELELSASVIDLGFIRWRSNLNTFSGEGEFVYQGSLDNTIPTDDYLNGLLDELMESFEFDVTQEKYTTFLPTIIMAGANYEVSNTVDVGLMGRFQFYRTKAIPSLTLQGQYNPFKSVHIMASYTAQYYDYKQVGLGLAIGTSPVQFYAISDNLIGMIWPLSSRSINFRFGFNLLFGCKKSSKSRETSSSCYGMGQTHKKPYMKNLKRGSFDRKN